MIYWEIQPYCQEPLVNRPVACLSITPKVVLDAYEFHHLSIDKWNSSCLKKKCGCRDSNPNIFLRKSWQKQTKYNFHFVSVVRLKKEIKCGCRDSNPNYRLLAE